MSEIKTHYRKLLNPDYLGEYEFAPGEEKLVTIRTVDINEITGTGGKKDNKPVMHFVEQVKPLILNSTNFKMLTKLFKSPYIEDWAGKQIVLYGDPTVTFGKEVVGGVRIRKELPQSSVCTDCGQIIGASGKFTAKQIAQSTQNTYNRALCMDCAKEAKAKQNAVHEADEKTAREAELQAFHAEALAEARDNKEGEETNA